MSAETEQRGSRHYTTASLVAAIVCVTIAGCGNPLKDPVFWPNEPDPPGPIVQVSLEGYWWAYDGFGYLAVNAISDSALDCWAVWGTWSTDGFPSFPKYLSWLEGVTVYDLAVNDSGRVTSSVRGSWLRDSTGAYTIPMPDSLGVPVTRVHGQFSDSMTVFAGLVEDTPGGPWREVWDTIPGFELEAWIYAPKLRPVSVCEKLVRIGPHRQSMAVAGGDAARGFAWSQWEGIPKPPANSMRSEKTAGAKLIHRGRTEPAASHGQEK